MIDIGHLGKWVISETFRRKLTSRFVFGKVKHARFRPVDFSFFVLSCD